MGFCPRLAFVGLIADVRTGGRSEFTPNLVLDSSSEAADDARIAVGLHLFAQDIAPWGNELPVTADPAWRDADTVRLRAECGGHLHGQGRICTDEAAIAQTTASAEGAPSMPTTASAETVASTPTTASAERACIVASGQIVFCGVIVAGCCL